jgi:hypothetical protein
MDEHQMCQPARNVQQARALKMRGDVRTGVDAALVLIHSACGVDGAGDWAPLVYLSLHGRAAMHPTMPVHCQAPVLLDGEAALEGHTCEARVQLIALRANIDDIGCQYMGLEPDCKRNGSQRMAADCQEATFWSIAW